MKRIWKAMAIAVLAAVLGVVAVGAAVYAQDDGSTTGGFDFATRFKEALAGILGVSVDEYNAAVDKAQQQVVDEAVSEGWLTQDQAEIMAWRLQQAPDGAMPGFGPGLGGRGHGPGGSGGDNLLSIAADKLGISLSDLLTELQGGKSIAALATEKGVDTQTIVDAYVAQVKEDLDEAVADGNITQKQAEYQLQQAEQRVTDRLDDTGLGGLGGHGGRHGDMMGVPGAGGL